MHELLVRQHLYPGAVQHHLDPAAAGTVTRSTSRQQTNNLAKQRERSKSRVRFLLPDDNLSSTSTDAGVVKFSVMDSRQTRRVNQARYGATNNRSAWGYWVPLAITVTAATVGLAAWIWSERKEEEEDSSADEQYRPGGRPPAGYANMSGGLGPGPGPDGVYVDQPPPGGVYQGDQSQPQWQPSNRSIGAQSTGVEETRAEEAGLVARMSKTLGMGRSASPSKAYDWASRNVTAGVAAVGAAVGGALGYSEENKGQYEDHSRWSEEVERKQSETAVRPGIERKGTAHEFYSGAVDLPRSASISSRQKRKTVALVVSSVQDHSDDDVGSHAVSVLHSPCRETHN